MAYTVEDFARQFYRLLPHGNLWPTQDLSDADWHKYVRAFVSETQRVNAAGDEWLADFWADGTDTQLEDWERVLNLTQTAKEYGIDLADRTKAERRSLVLASLRKGAQTSAELVAVGTDYGFADAEVGHPLRPHRVAGSLAGSGAGGSQWPHSFWYAYMPDDWIPGDKLSDLSSTGGTITVTPNAAVAPDGTTTADEADVTTFGSVTETGLALTPDAVLVGGWFRSDTAGAQVKFVANGTYVGASEDFPVGPYWKRLQARIPVTAGDTIDTVGYSWTGTQVMDTWGLFMGEVDLWFEMLILRQIDSAKYCQFRMVNDTFTYGDFSYP